MRLPRVRFTVWQMMTTVAVMAILAGVLVPWFRNPSTPPAAAPAGPNKVLMDGVDINSNGSGPLAPDRPSLLDDRQSGQRSLLPPDLGTGQQP